MSGQTGTEASPREPNFGGLRVVAFESRMASETARLIERNGGLAMVAPAMREIPLGDNPAALEFADRLLAGQIDIAIFLFFFFQAEDGIRDWSVTGVQTCALPI